MSGNFDAVGGYDLAVYDTASGKWYIKPVSGNPFVCDLQWGFSGCVPVSGDFGNTSHHDLCVYHSSGYWYILSLTGHVLANGVPWGFSGCVPVSGDYDGDNKDDMNLFYPPTGYWYVRKLNGTVLLNQHHIGP